MRCRSKYLFSIVVVSLLLFAACKKDHSNNSVNNGGNGSTADCKACAYVPTCVNSSYTYQDSSAAGTAVLSSFTYTAISDTTIDGSVFQKASSSLGGSSSYINCNNGVTTTVAYNLVSVSGQSHLEEAKLIPLKANGAVGTTWEDSVYNSSAGIYDYYNYTIVATGSSRVVLGSNFTNVIDVHSETSINVPYYYVGGESEYYYAKGVGLIESILADPYGNVYYHQSLKTFNIP